MQSCYPCHRVLGGPQFYIQPDVPLAKIHPLHHIYSRETTLHDRITHSINYRSLFPFTLR